MMKFRIPIIKSKYETYLSILNGALLVQGSKGFTKKEREVLATFMTIRDTLVPDNEELVFSAPMRKKVQKLLNMSEYNLNNYINSLSQKYALTKDDEGILFISNYIIPSFENGRCIVEFELVDGKV